MLPTSAGPSDTLTSSPLRKAFTMHPNNTGARSPGQDFSPPYPTAVTADAAELHHAALETPTHQSPRIGRWYVLAVEVPPSWNPDGLSWRTAVPSTSPALPHDVASKVARELNITRIQRAAGGLVNVWTIRTNRGAASGFLTVNIPPFIPTGPDDLPPGVQSFEGTRAEFREFVAQLNSTAKPGHVRFVLVLPIHPGESVDQGSSLERDATRPEPRHLAGAAEPGGRPHDLTGPPSKDMHLALVHSRFGVLAKSAFPYPLHDASRLLAEARVALVH